MVHQNTKCISIFHDEWKGYVESFHFLTIQDGDVNIFPSNQPDDHVAKKQFLSIKPDYPYPCLSCSIAFKTVGEYRTHAKEPWHIFNVKKQSNNQNPLSKEEFELLLSVQKINIDSNSKNKDSIIDIDDIDDVDDTHNQGNVNQKRSPRLFFFTSHKRISIWKNILSSKQIHFSSLNDSDEYESKLSEFDSYVSRLNKLQSQTKWAIFFKLWW